MEQHSVPFGALSTVGQVLGYKAGMRPTIDYQPATRPRLTKLKFLGLGFALQSFQYWLVLLDVSIRYSASQWRIGMGSGY